MPEGTRDGEGKRRIELRVMIDRKGKPPITLFRCDVDEMLLELDACDTALREARAEIERLRAVADAASQKADGKTAAERGDHLRHRPGRTHLIGE